MTIPPYLKEGSVIGITCPSSYIALSQIEYAASVLESKGFKVKLGATAGNMHHYFSGTDDERRADLQTMLDDPNIDAILMGRGGYGMGRIIDGLNFDTFVEKPKWICGFSDIIILQSHVQANFDIAVLHSPMCNAYKEDLLGSAHLQSFFDAVTGKALNYTTSSPSSYNRAGKAEGILTGGNLAILAHITGSMSEVDMAGKILFIEDIGEVFYNMDRLMINLKRAGKLKDLKGLIVGGLTDMQDTERPFGQSIEQIIFGNVAEYGYPVCFNFPCGHQELNYTLTLGMKHQLIVDEKGGSLKILR